MVGRVNRARLAVLVSLAFASGARGDDAQPIDAGAKYDDDASLPQHAEDVVDYTMTAELDPNAHTVHGEGTIVWRNTSETAVREVWVHLYLNAFKNEESTFMREPTLGSRGSGGVNDWGAIDVRKFALDGVDLWPSADKTGGRPGDQDETDVRVPLPREVPPGGSVTFETTWDDKLPAVVERTGYHGSFHMIAQWFPKIARLEPDGRWAHFPFHHLAEFYADFGTYDVTIKAPKAYTMGATGPVVESRDEGDLHVERHVQRDVHDFAWTAFDQYQERTERIAGVNVRVLYPRGYGYVAERSLATIRFALPHYNQRYGKYPYDVLTIVHPPDGAEEAGGMEYPTLFTSEGSWYGPPGVNVIELVTIHEFGHQWFYGLLASDEVTWPFLDEGMNSYAEEEGLHAWLGEGSMVDLMGLKISDADLDGAWPGWRVYDVPVASPAFAFPTGSHYGGLVYARTASIFETVDRVWGRELGARAIGRYARRARFRHPTPEDLLASYEEVVGQDARAMIEEALFHEGWVDFRIEAIHSPRVAPALGIFDRDGKRETVKESTPSDDAGGEYDGFVLVARQGTLVMPVDVDVTLKDGTTTRLHWDGKERFARLPFHGNSPIAFAVVDPDHKVLIDRDRTNDFMRTGNARAPQSSRVLERLTYAAQLFFSEIAP
jgi:hypothetical protein